MMSKSYYYDWCLKAWLTYVADEQSLLVWKNAERITETEYQEIIMKPR